MYRRPLFALLLLACSSVLLANPDRPPPPDPEARFERLATTLSLSDAQRPQVRALMQRHHEQMRELHDQGRVLHQGADDEVEVELERVLSPGQMQRWREHRQSHRPPMPRDRPAPGDRRR